MTPQEQKNRNTIIVMFIMVTITAGLVLRREGYDVGWHHGPAMIGIMLAVLIVGALGFAALEWIAGFMARRGWGGRPRQ